MKLTIHPRNNLKKGETQRIRREGDIPGVLYGKSQENETFVIKGEDLKAILRNMKSGLLATTTFELSNGNKTFKAIVKDIHYHPVSYAVEHVDFLLLDDNRAVIINAPINMVGVNDCAGTKQGGFLRQIIRTIKVRCLPKDIPSEFVFDVRNLNMNEVKRLSDLAIPSNVRPIARMNEVAVVVSKARSLEVAAAETTAAATAAAPGAAAAAPGAAGAPAAGAPAAGAPTAAKGAAPADKKPAPGKK
ncbi:MAG: 50S ribosomal protein L25 [Verrucomicrobiota bacterium]|nr:50S ribosomal protein L25 [Verrucomicrobiota bacterium]